MFLCFYVILLVSLSH